MTAKNFVIADDEIVIYPSMFTRYIFYLLFFFFIACLTGGSYILAESANSNSLSPGSYLLFLNGLFFLVLSLFAYARMRRRIIIDRSKQLILRKSVFGVRLLARFSELSTVKKSYLVAHGSAHVNYYYAIQFKDPSAAKEIILTNSYTKSNHPKLHGFEAQVLPVLNQWLLER
ncbi:hypothetical protein [Pedobacter sp. MC2016-24]|uniref:hypothetical protein n=1 Tax=Pedobacter sp. MC2016-24 TaxID=2780090 RepID=UPI00187E1C44|nr:hypothetical protein [Pedobacter sp. MC2016-24]MBE9601466.1 hypothetical protein [Pedobacter sp. MC2016-24]